MLAFEYIRGAAPGHSHAIQMGNGSCDFVRQSVTESVIERRGAEIVERKDCDRRNRSVASPSPQKKTGQAQHGDEARSQPQRTCELRFGVLCRQSNLIARRKIPALVRPISIPFRRDFWSGSIRNQLPIRPGFG